MSNDLDDVVISVESLDKEYRLGTIGSGTLFRDLQSWWARVRGGTDPNSQVNPEGIALGSKASKGNPRFLALQNVNFQVKQGEVLGIIGRNGAGKSTLLKILSRVTSPTRGRMRVKGRIASLLEVGTGFHPELTGRENIYLNGAILGMTHREVSSKFDQIIEFAELERFVDTPVKRYSSGMYVRLAFAVAAHLDPEILIIDEVLAVGDVRFQDKCLGKMKDVSAKEGRTVLFVSHNMGLISSLCDRVILLEGGCILAQGRPSEVILRYYSSDNASPAHVDFVGLGQVIGDAYARLLTGAVRDNQEMIRNDFFLEEEVQVEMSFQILQRREFNRFYPYPSLHIYGTNGECVFYTSPPNFSNRTLDPGIFKAVCRIPANFLNAGTYFVAFGFADCDSGVNLHFYEKNAITFHIKENLSQTLEFRNGYGGTIPGAVRPRFVWTVSEDGFGDGKLSRGPASEKSN